MQEESIENMSIHEILDVSVKSINFGLLFPGHIKEETVKIKNTLKGGKVKFKIKVNCLVEEFDRLDEYVYSMRKPQAKEMFNYNDTFVIILSPETQSNYKLAVKVPNVRSECRIMGNIIISMGGREEVIEVPITTQIILPKIKCEKMLKMKEFEHPVIRLYMKNQAQQNFRIILKNLSLRNCSVDFKILKNVEK